MGVTRGAACKSSSQQPRRKGSPDERALADFGEEKKERRARDNSLDRRCAHNVFTSIGVIIRVNFSFKFIPAVVVTFFLSFLSYEETNTTVRVYF